MARQSPKPPVAKYDARRDVTVYSTGDVRTAGYSGYGAQFEFRGKSPTAPASIDMGFGALRLSSGPDQDQSRLHWNGVKTISISFAGHTQEFPAVHEFKVSTNPEVTIFLGRGLEESMSISLTPPQLKAIAAADSIRVQLGKDTQFISRKSLGPLRKLVACIPPS